MNRLRALLLCLGLALLGTQAAKAQAQSNPPTNLAQQVPGIPVEVQNNIRPFNQKRPDGGWFSYRSGLFGALDGAPSLPRGND